MRKNILVLGGAGYIGKHLVKVFSNHNVFIYGRKSKESTHNISKTIIGDFSDKILLKSKINIIKPDIIFYSLSNYKINHKTFDLILSNLEKNIKNFLNFVSNKTKVVYIGSAAVYGRVGEDGRLLCESSNVLPISIYGKYKLEEENIFFKYSKIMSKKVVFVRLFNIIGPNEPIRMVAGSFISQLLNKTELNVGNLSPYRDFIDIRDAVLALKVVSEYGKINEIYNICSGKAIKINNLLKKIIDIMDIKPKINICEKHKKSNDIEFIAGNNKKIKKLNWNQKINIDKSIYDLIQSYK